MKRSLVIVLILAIAVFASYALYSQWGTSLLPAKTAPSQGISEQSFSTSPSSPLTQDREETDSSTGTRVYESGDRTVRFEYPSTLNVTTAVDGAITVPGLLKISKRPYSELSVQKPIVNYESCCSGQRYWYDPVLSQWQAQKIQAGQYDDQGNHVPDPRETFPLSSGGMCTIKETFGSRSFYKIFSGDEGVQPIIYYLIPTDQGYALEFTTGYDLKKDYSGYSVSARPDQNILDASTRVLESVTVSGSVHEVSATCR